MASATFCTANSLPNYGVARSNICHQSKNKDIEVCANLVDHIIFNRDFRDVTDNKTSDSPYAFSSKYAMNELYRSEVERQKTFEQWPLDFLDKNTLAQTGMVYFGEGDKVKCHFCGVEIGMWMETDEPVSEHIKWSPNCPLMRRRTASNIPVDASALDRILPPASYDICGSNAPIEVRHAAYPEGSISSGSLTEPGPSSAPVYQMDYPEYAIEPARFRSFAEWPRTMSQKPKDLAEAGFFYTGKGDRVNCFSCGGGLKDWDIDDKPWEQHALWLSKCRYLKLMKGQAFIDEVIAKHKLAAEKIEEALMAASDVEVQECGTQTEGRQQQNNSTLTPATETHVGKDLLQRSDSNNSEKKIIAEEKACKICYAAEYNTAFLPCGHVVACAKCASSVDKCPVCRKPFTDVTRVYFS